jgi:SPP1 family phage portal protein
MNYDHVEVFSVLEFAPLQDEENGALRAGVRFWQIDQTKPLRATLYEEDGYTELIWRKGKKGEILKPKRSYKLFIRESEADGTEIYDGENYPTFPIVPLWANNHHQSEIVGIREGIDAYDLIKSGAASDIDEAAQIYWVIQNAGGMDDVDLRKFIERLKVVKAATMDEDGAVAEPHTINIPYEARESILSRIEKDLYKDFMALDTENIASGAVTTATQIRAAYEPLNNKVDEFEHCVGKFIDGLLKIAGKDVKYTLERSMNINVQETVQTVIMAADHLSDEYVTRKILTAFGDGDLTEDMVKELDAEDMQKVNLPPREDNEWTEGTSSQTNA